MITIKVSAPAAPIIKELAMNLLQKKGRFEIPELKEYAEKSGYTFTQGQFAGALRSMLDNTAVVSTERGVYELNSTTDIISQDLKNQINQVLDQTLHSLRQLANVNLLEVDDSFMKEIRTLREVINAIESLKK
ncbi:hypothetical protein [Paenibacillus medicaginis]|uniref:HTH HARE-type domain-containing protein n=1 Tax=Paenibacillus medicaginis TaxID=1470560 RepID=A0ABV5C715_9BACL